MDPRLLPSHFNPPTLAPPKDASMADTFYDRLEKRVADAQGKLKPGEVLTLTFHSGAESIEVNDIGYHNPNLIVLYGRDGVGNECRVLVHMSSVALVCKTVNLADAASRKIGFVGNEQDDAH
jgi:hypothetical protein